MHKYQPRVHIVRLRGGGSGAGGAGGGVGGAGGGVGGPAGGGGVTARDLLATEDCRTFAFPETVFTAVTAYQNQLVSES